MLHFPKKLQVQIMLEGLRRHHSGKESIISSKKGKFFYIYILGIDHARKACWKLLWPVVQGLTLPFGRPLDRNRREHNNQRPTLRSPGVMSPERLFPSASDCEGQFGGFGRSFA